MKRGKSMVSAIAIFIIAINVYIYLKNKKDK
nr:MAG TPA: antigen S-antigen protein [Caudoviricetes sp.]DAW58465.1 MAG TPA: antigen S-antigen protein [Caudoviricetes sp.]